MPIIDTKDMSLEEVKALYEAEANAHDKDNSDNTAKIEELNKAKSDLEESYKKKEEETNKTIAKLRIEALKAPKEDTKKEEDKKEENNEPQTIQELAKFMVENN